MPPAKKDKATTYVYIRDKDFAWRPAILQETKAADLKAIVTVPEYKDEQSMLCDGGRGAKTMSAPQTVDLKQYQAQVLPLQNVDAQGQLAEYADMVKLPYLHEAGILYNLKSRHMNCKPYTRTGDIVIACNPFQWFKDLYTEKKRAYYSNRLVWESSDGDPRDGMEPHVYEVSALSYKGLAFGNGDQSILVSGESGAGKTETVKIAMNHMAVIQAGHKTVLEGDQESGLDPVVKKVVESNPLLEAFGNAKTRRNDNSSRFGKYLQLQFDNQKPSAFGGGTSGKSHCTLAGSKCDVYLLEKNRVTTHDDLERTYHIFYQLLAAPDSDKAHYWPALKGTNNKSFKYVMDTHTKTIEGMTDAQHYEHTVSTLDLIGVNGAKLDTLMRAVAIVLQAGNLTFGAKGGDKDKSDITSKDEAAKLAQLMGVTDQDLTLALTERTMKTKTEEYKVPLNTVFAKDSADAFAKEVYGKLFLWVVRQINTATRAEENYKNGSMTEFGIIGLLDIFGFESFARNRFEQLCINYANEKLQQKFTEDVFQAVQIEYESEGIALAEIQYDDNTDVLDLIEGRTGLLAMLNEECVRPKGSDKDFVNKALASNKSSPCLIVNKTDNMSFGIHHYAGKVMYDAEAFVASNQDTLPTDLEELMKKCNNDIAAQPSCEEAPVEPPGGGARSAPKRQKSNIVGETVWGKYKTQLASLMTNLRKTSSRYIRCIKPNMAKKPILMEHNATVEQLRCAGVIAAVTLARSAFPNKLDNAAVMFRYGSMWDKKSFPPKATDGMSSAERYKVNAEQCMASALKDKIVKNDDGEIIKSHIVGKTRTYFRAGVLEFLEANRADGLDTQAVTIQRIARGMITRKRFRDRLEAGVRAEREAREAREAASRAAKEKAEREMIERSQTRKKDLEKYEDQLRLLQKQHKEADQYKERLLEEVEEAKKQALADIEELREQTGADARAKMMEPKKIAKQQKAKLESQTSVIENLKKENKKIRKENDKIKEKFSQVKVNNDKLIKANEDAGGSFETITESAEKVNERNEVLIDTLEQAKRDNKNLKEACMKRQEEYMTQAETRLEYQKTMARILNLIQESSKDGSVIEDTVCIALECEAEAKGVMAALEAETED